MIQHVWPSMFYQIYLAQHALYNLYGPVCMVQYVRAIMYSPACMGKECMAQYVSTFIKLDFSGYGSCMLTVYA
jgi:hypothetical protein